MIRNRLMQLVAQNAGAGTPLSVVRNEAGIEVQVYDVIDPWFGVSAKAFAEAIKGAGSLPLTVRLNSPGGDVFEGRAIASQIRAHKGPTVAVVDGLAASAASTIAVAASSLTMAQGSFLMVHRSWAWTMDNAEGLRGLAALLEKIDGSIAGDYVAKSGASLAQAEAWMNAETWFTADEAVAAKLADAVGETEAQLKPFNLKAFDNAPAALLARLVPPGDPSPPEADFAALRAHSMRRMRLLDYAA
jgi:ATP-dependent Clp protease, protease subunit